MCSSLSLGRFLHFLRGMQYDDRSIWGCPYRPHAAVVCHPIRTTGDNIFGVAGELGCITKLEEWDFESRVVGREELLGWGRQQLSWGSH